MPLAHLHCIDPWRPTCRASTASMLRRRCSGTYPSCGPGAGSGPTAGRASKPVLPLKKRRERHRKPPTEACGGAICLPAKCYRQTMRCEIGQALR